MFFRLQRSFTKIINIMIRALKISIEANLDPLISGIFIG
jgi:hypothetical protein